MVGRVTLLVCLALLVSLASASPKVPISKLPNSAQLLCETCQALAYTKHKQFQSAVKSTFRGGEEIAAEALFEAQPGDPDGVCSWKLLASIAETATPKHDVSHMMRACDHILESHTDAFVAAIAKGLSQDAVRKKVCVSKSLCKTEKELWTPEQFPSERSV